MDKYQIIDEPNPSLISYASTNPLWPLLALMIASPIYGLLWFILNSIAIGSPTKIKEIIVATLGILFISFFYLFLTQLQQSESVYLEYFDYIRLSGIIVSIAISYYICFLQMQPFQLYEYFNGKVISGIPGLIIGFFIGGKLQAMIATLITSGFI